MHTAPEIKYFGVPPQHVQGAVHPACKAPIHPYWGVVASRYGSLQLLRRSWKTASIPSLRSGEVHRYGTSCCACSVLALLYCMPPIHLRCLSCCSLYCIHPIHHPIHPMGVVCCGGLLQHAKYNTTHSMCCVADTGKHYTLGCSVPCKHTTHSGVLCTRGTQPVSPSTGLYTTLYTPYGVWVGCDAPHTRRRATRARRESKQRSRLLRHSTAPPVRCRNSRSALLRCAILVPQLGPLVPLRGPCGPAPRP